MRCFFGGGNITGGTFRKSEAPYIAPEISLTTITSFSLVLN